VTDTWTLSEAKAKLSEIVDKANRDGPQTITRHGRTVAQVIPVTKDKKKTGKKKKPEEYDSLGDFFENSPLKGSGIHKFLVRKKDPPRKIDL
jgi:prevent-host-death family protein